MADRIQLAEVSIDVTRKNIKNLHLSVYPPTGTVRISAPSRMKLETIRVFALGKLTWIRKQQRKLQTQERETQREYINRESHYLWGKRYLLSIHEAEQPPSVQLKASRIHLTVRTGADQEKRREILTEWYREALKKAAEPLIAKWEGILKVKCRSWSIRRMKTKWGSCNTSAGRVLLNLELAKKPILCLDYLIAHELAHLIERRHNDRFAAILDRHLSNWRQIRNQLNILPLDFQHWSR